MNHLYRVDILDVERDTLHALTHAGKVSARKVARAQILLMADGRQFTDGQIATALGVGTSTVYRTRRAFVEEGLEAALSEAPRPGGERKLLAAQEATLVAIACSEPPEGRSRWTLQLLAGRLVALTDVESISIETIRRRLAEKELKPWQKKMWCIAKLDADFVAQMEHILDLYAEPPAPKRPLVNFDEALKQLVGETRAPLPAHPGQLEKYDYEYKRMGVANIYLFFDRHRCWRHASVTETKGNLDFAQCMKDLVDVHYPEADVIRVVMDNLKPHRSGVLYQAFPPEEARRILRRLEFHYTPKHASWLNMVEIEIGVMNKQCLDRRIPDMETLTRELGSWEAQRTEEKATIQWLFNIDKARTKLTRAYDGLNRSKPL